MAAAQTRRARLRGAERPFRARANRGISPLLVSVSLALVVVRAVLLLLLLLLLLCQWQRQLQLVLLLSVRGAEKLILRTANAPHRPELACS